MILDTPAFLSQSPKGPLLGIDYGQARVGLAISDRLWTIASPLTVLTKPRFQAVAKAIVGLIAEHDLQGCVIGLPLELDGKLGRQAQSVRQFGINLEKKINISICFWDERFSTAAVEHVLAEAHSSRQRQREIVDKMAAAYMLQGFLDRYKYFTAPPS